MLSFGNRCTCWLSRWRQGFAVLGGPNGRLLSGVPSLGFSISLCEDVRFIPRGICHLHAPIHMPQHEWRQVRKVAGTEKAIKCCRYQFMKRSSSLISIRIPFISMTSNHNIIKKKLSFLFGDPIVFQCLLQKNMCTLTSCPLSFSFLLHRF